MRLVAVSVVANEADIVEAFVRHTTTRVDQLVVVDDASTDGTRDILTALVREGLPLTLFRATARPDHSPIDMSNFVRRAFEEFNADWVMPLEADEFLTGPGRTTLEQLLLDVPRDEATALPIDHYTPSTADDASERNPALRIRYRQRAGSGSLRVFLSRALGLQSNIRMDQGHHVVTQDDSALGSRILPGFRLARLAMRSPQQQLLKMVTGELQRLSRGATQAGLETHNRLGFQLLERDADAFLTTTTSDPNALYLDPIPYVGGALKYAGDFSELTRATRAFLPFLENLARSHGALLDQTRNGASAAVTEDAIHALEPAELAAKPEEQAAPFTGFVPLAGWQNQEGPVPSAFLPVFHWTTAPETVLSVYSETARISALTAEVLTYVERQVVTVVLNGKELLRHVFPQVNQKESISVPLELVAGENHLVFRHRSWLRSDADPRKLALIFLSLRIQQA